MDTTIIKELRSRGLAVTAGTKSFTVTAATDFDALELAVAAAESPKAQLSVLESIKKFIKRNWSIVGAGGFMYYRVYNAVQQEIKRHSDDLRRNLVRGLQNYDRGNFDKAGLREYTEHMLDYAKVQRNSLRIATLIAVASVTGLLLLAVRASNKAHDHMDASIAKKDAAEAARRLAREKDVVKLDREAKQLLQKAKTAESKAA